jgi:hypothetical protein
VSGLAQTLSALVARLEAMALAEDEHAPHVVLVVDPDCGVGPAVGPFPGVMAALTEAARLEAALNADVTEPPVKVEVVRLFSASRSEPRTPADHGMSGIGGSFGAPITGPGRSMQ